jgi:hypothetical protein
MKRLTETAFSRIALPPLVTKDMKARVTHLFDINGLLVLKLDLITQELVHASSRRKSFLSLITGLLTLNLNLLCL